MQYPKDIMISGTIDRQLVVVVAASAERDSKTLPRRQGAPTTMSLLAGTVHTIVTPWVYR
jgi:hypothetical protein